MQNRLFTAFAPQNAHIFALFYYFCPPIHTRRLMKVSIIIPVFRTEQTLARCIDSVLAQSFADWEMLLIDDGSDDDAPLICDQYAQKDERISVIHQQNAGLGPARNTGLDAARGEYVLFVDSDDFLESTTLEKAVEMLETYPKDVAFVEFPVMRYLGHPKKQSMLRLTNECFTDVWQWWFHAEGYAHCYAWNKLFRRNAIGNLRFENRIFEDVFFMIPLLRQRQCVATMTEGVYYYCYNPHGITANEGKGLADLLEAHARVYHSIGWKRPKGVSQTDFKRYFAHALNIQIDVYDRCQRLTLLHRMPFGGTPKLWAQRILGIRLSCQIINMLRHLCQRLHHL